MLPSPFPFTSKQFTNTKHRGPPPPFIKFPTIKGFKIEGPLPPWPEITIGRDRQLTYSSEPTSCSTKTASVCTTTTIFSATTIDSTSTRTTATSTSRRCETVRGCEVTNTNIRTSSTTVASCTPSALVKARSEDGNDTGVLEPRQGGEGCGKHAIVYPVDPKNVGEIPTLLSAYAGKYETIGVPALNIVGFYWVPFLDEETLKKLQNSPAVDGAYYYQDWNDAVGPPDQSDDINGELALPTDRDGINDDDLLGDDDERISLASPLLKRARKSTPSKFWTSSVVSLPKGMLWKSDGSESYDARDAEGPFLYQWDDTGGSTDYSIYFSNEKRVWRTHPEFTDGFQGEIEKLVAGAHYNAPSTADNADATHGTCVAAYAIGAKLGICKKCRGVWIDSSLWAPGDPGFNHNFIRERGIAHLMTIYQEIVTKGNAKKSVINMSWSYPVKKATDPTLRSTRWALGELDKMGVVLVASSGNHAKEEGKEITRFPARFASPDAAKNSYGHLKNLIVVGATSTLGREWDGGQSSSYLTTFAPGTDVRCPSDPAGSGTDLYAEVGRSGTSVAAPQVAALAAYWRSLDTKWKTQLEDPANVKKLIQLFHRRYGFFNPQNGKSYQISARSKPVIWNGQVKDKNCLIHYDTRDTWDATTKACPEIPDDLSTLSDNPGEPVDCNNTPANPPASSKHKRQSNSGGSCPLNPGGGSDADKSISYKPGPTPSPTCGAGGNRCGGSLCTGFYCSPRPTGIPPDFMDPKDPNAGNPVPTTHIPGPGTSTRTSATGNPPTTTSTGTPACDDKCKLDRGNPCVCSETGCDEQSPACCHNASCPKCECDEANCTPESPACCLSGTCQWQYTGGGGGLPQNVAGVNRVMVPPPSGSSRGGKGLVEDPEHVDAVYEVFSWQDGEGRFVVGGYSGNVTGEEVGGGAKGGNETVFGADWVFQAGNVTELQTRYTGLSAYNTTCDFLASSVLGYEGMEPGTTVGALTCEGFAPATCFRGDFKGELGVGRAREEFVCKWE